MHWYDLSFQRALQNHFPDGGFDVLEVLGVSVTISTQVVRCNGLTVYQSGAWFAKVPKLRSYLVKEYLKDNRAGKAAAKEIDHLQEIFG